MAGNDVFLFGVPSDGDPDDVRLYDINGPIAGTASITLDDDTLVSTAVLAIAGTASIVLDDDTVSSAAVLAIAGSLSVTLDDDTVVATATMPAVVPALPFGRYDIGGAMHSRRAKDLRKKRRADLVEEIAADIAADADEPVTKAEVKQVIYDKTAYMIRPVPASYMDGLAKSIAVAANREIAQRIDDEDEEIMLLAA